MLAVLDGEQLRASGETCYRALHQQVNAGVVYFDQVFVPPRHYKNAASGVWGTVHAAAKGLPLPKLHVSPHWADV